MSLIIPHVRVIHIRQHPQGPHWQFLLHPSVQLQLDIFRPRPPHIRIQVNSIRNLGHQSFREPHHVIVVVIFHQRRVRKPRVSAA